MTYYVILPVKCMNIAVNVNNIISLHVHVHHSTCRPEITCTHTPGACPRIYRGGGGGNNFKLKKKYKNIGI